MKPYPAPIHFGDFTGDTEDMAAANEAVKAAAATVKVLYHSIELRRGSYLMDDDPKARPATDGREWIKLRLNELGYFAGRVDAELTDQYRRAIKRYSYECPGLVESDEESGALKAALAKDNVRNVFLTATTGVPFAVDVPTAIEDSTVNARGYVEHNYFYDSKGQNGTEGFSERDGHAEQDRRNLDRFELPVEARINLASKDVADFARGQGIYCPEAVGPIEIQWTVLDPPEDDTLLPVWSADNPSATKAYIKKAHETLAAKPGDVTEPGDNCPEEFGGVRTRENPASIYFAPNHAAYRSRGSAAFFTSAYQNPDVEAAATNKIGIAGALFRGSCIGGDNFKIRAALTFEGQTNAETLKSAHTAQKKLLTAETGILTIWRRKRVSGVIDLVPAPLTAIDWTDTVAAYKSAHIDLDVAGATLIDLDGLLTGDEKALWVAAFVGPLTKAASWKPDDVAQMKAEAALRIDQLDPFPPPPEDALDVRVSQIRNSWWITFNGTLPKASSPAEAEKARQPGLRQVLLQALGRTRRPGFVVVRSEWLAGRAKKDGTRWEASRNGDSSIGMPGGFALLSMSHVETYKDGFIVTHEMAHTAFIQHSFNTLQAVWKSADGSKKREDLKGFENPMEHDLSDLNCVMSYPNIAGLKGPKSPPPSPARPTVNAEIGEAGVSVLKFCGKCILKLRGWRIAGGFADQPHKLNEDFGLSQDWRAFDDDEAKAKNNRRLPYRTRPYADALAGKPPPS